MAHRKLTFAEHQQSDLKFPVSVLADNIALKENLGSLFRLCDALAIEHLYLSKTDGLANNKLSKVARHTENRVPHSLIQTPLDTIAKLKQDGYTIVSLEITSHSENIQNINFESFEQTCLILGNEAKGVSDDLLDVSDYCVHIPMLGMNSSMNVICAASIALFEMTRHYS